MKRPRVAQAVLSAAVALMSGVTLLVLLLMIPLPAMLIQLAIVWWLGVPSLFAFMILFGFSVVIGSAAGLLGAIALARFVLRIWPIDASGVVRKRCLLWQRRIAWSFASVILLICASVVLQRIIGEGYFRPGAAPEEGIIALLFPCGWAAWGVTVAGGLALSSWVHGHPTYFSCKEFFLYLRRFSSFADRTVVSEVLRAAPKGVPVVFIASPQGYARNWDPIVWAFSGLRFSHPLASFPVQLRTPDALWEQAIASLLSRATGVVMDLTDASPSLEREKLLVAQGVHPERTIWLVERLTQARGHKAGSALAQVEQRQLIVYRRRWALLGLAVKLGLFLLVGYGIFLPFGLIWAENRVTLMSATAGILLVGGWLLAGVVLVFRPSIDREARHNLKRFMFAAIS